MPGVIKLIDPIFKKSVKSAYYNNPDDMRQTIEVWRRLYGVGIEQMFIHVIPSLKINYEADNTTETKQPGN